MTPDDVVARLGASGLRGRGGGWFPAARKWAAVRREGGACAVVGNGAEGEPGSIKDRFVMTRRPAAVIAGLRAAATALGADEAVVYLKGEFAGPAASLEAAVSGSTGLAVRVHRGDDSYVAGEETALIESLEGRRAWPRPKPPRPAVVGLGGRPTLVHNVETLSRIPAAIEAGAAYARDETTLVSLWGDVARPGVYEVPLGTPLGRVIDEWGGGAPRGVGLVFPAGPSAAPLSGDALHVALDPEALRAAGSGLGTASILVVDRHTCPVSVATSLADFFEREACGQCPPCSVGCATLARTLTAVEAGDARPRDLAHLAEAAGFMKDHGYCAHSRTAAASVTGLLARIPDDVAAHIAARRCPRPGDRQAPFDPGSAARLAIEASLEMATGSVS